MSRVLLLAFVAALALFPTAAGAGASGVVVSQIYGGGGNAGATFRNDYVELFNAGSGAVDLSGWTVQIRHRYGNDLADDRTFGDDCARPLLPGSARIER
jgi:hypothetical protein